MSNMSVINAYNSGAYWGWWDELWIRILD